ncbi:Avt1p [Sporobolomyces koalae]|uniref:Avt1p n=1 Tax=Sporobolomyces koalae TaxID=500713 RepID=UPI00317DF9AB
MASRRIPISSTNRNAPPAASTTTPFRSSLDLVFSFSRSAGFFGENLPTGPSFVDEGRYRPPNYPADDEDDSVRARSHERDTTGGTTSEGEDPDQSYADDDEDPTEWDDDEPALVDSRGRPTSAEQLPRNAKRHVPPLPHHQTRTILATSPSADPASARPSATPSARTSFAPTLKPSLQARAHPDLTERSPLLPASGPQASSRDSPAPHASSAAARKPSYGSAQTSGVRSRRPSTFSREAWKAAIEEHRGESTWGQTLFNTVNVLVGVGLLADPLAFAYGGWIIGTLLLVFCALITNYTAKMLAALMRLDPTQHTYADVLISAFGPRSRRWIYALFVIELGTFSVAAIELFADSLNSLFPRISSNLFKAASYFILVPTTFLPLRLLSLTSLLGILSSVVLLSVIIADGTIKTTAPGSLWEPMTTSLGPNWKKLPICFGLMMSGFSGHAVVPSLYRDMKYPQHFHSMINVAYVIAFSVSLVFAVLGYVMFGNSVSAEITKDLSRTAGYPVALTKVAVWMVAINPLVKYAVANKPLVTTFEHLIGLADVPAPTEPSPATNRPALTSAISFSSSESGADPEPAPSPTRSRRRERSSFSHASWSETSAAAGYNPLKTKRVQRIRYWVLRPVLSIVFVLVAIAIPDFDRVLSFLGSASAFVICCIGPIGAYMILSVTPSRGAENDPDLEGTGGKSRSREGAFTKPTRDGSMSNPTTGLGSTSTRFDPNVVREIVQDVQSSNLSVAQRHLVDGVGHALVISRAERALCWVLLVTSIIMALVGTVWSFLPEF